MSIVNNIKLEKNFVIMLIHLMVLAHPCNRENDFYEPLVKIRHLVIDVQEGSPSYVWL